MADENGDPVIYDPAVYYGHREMELAMTSLFGGFGAQFYRSYNDSFPLESNWRDRQPLYKLYHILNHLNLFGNSYEAEALALMNHYL